MRPNDIAAIVFILLVVYLVATRKRRKQAKEAKQKAKKEAYINKLNSKDILLSGKHISGLPIAEGMQCSITYMTDKIEIRQGANIFNLDLAKITDINSTTDTEIKKQYVSSIGGAVGGAVLFGPLGAIVGGRAKEKKSKTVTHYFVITYRSDEEIKYISFEYTPSKNSTDFIARYNTLKPTNTVINL